MTARSAPRSARPGPVRGSGPARSTAGSGCGPGRAAGSRRLPLLILIGVLALASACAQSSVQPVAGPLTDTGAHPVVAPAQAEAVLAQVDAAVQRSMQSADPNQLGLRATGPFQREVAASLDVSTRLRRTPLAAPTITPTRLLIPRQSGWPRWFAAAGTSPTMSTPVLQVLLSPTARRPYALWGQLSLLPGQALPEVARADVGAAPLAWNATGLLATPLGALSEYADVLTRGSGSPYAARFANDLLRAQVQQTLVSERSELAKVATLTSRHQLTTQPLFAVRTLDGGALVIGALTEVYTVTVRPGTGSVQITDSTLSALVGRARLSRSATRLAIEVLAFRVPAAGSSEPITLVAAQRGVVQADGA